MGLKRYSALNRIAFCGLGGLLVWAPLPFGSLHVWAYTVLQLLAFFLFLLFLLDAVGPFRSGPVTWIKTPATPFLLLLVLLIVFQLPPLPPPLAAFISPLSHGDQSAMVSIFQAASGAENDPAWPRIAYAVYPTVREGLKAAVYLGIFFLTLHLLTTQKRIDALIYILIGIGLFEALYAVYETFSATPKIFWWTSRVGRAGFASGTFTVSNHFCFYLEMLFPLAIGSVFANRKRKKRFVPGLKQRKALAHRVVGWFAPESPNPKGLLLAGAALVMGLGLLLSASRGGILSMGAAAFIVAGLFFFRSDLKKYSFAILAVCFLVFAYGLHIGIDPTLQKFEHKVGLSSRLYTSWTLLPIIGDYPAAGVGLGNLRHLYARYAPPDPPVPFEGVSAAGHPHNDWLEMFAETGIAGGGLTLAAYLVFLFYLIRVWRRRRNRHAVGIGAGVIAGLLSVGFHSFFDFSLRIPANPVTLAVAAAIGYAALHRRGPDYDESFFYRVRTFHPAPPVRVLIVLCAAALAGGAGVLSVRHLQAEIRCPTQYNSTLNLNYTPYLADIEAAIDRFPWNPEYHLKRARFYARTAAPTKDQRGRYARRAIESLETSLRLNPAQPYAWHLLGRQYARRDADPVRYLDHWLPLADRCMDMSVSYAPREEAALARAGLYWVWRAAILPEDSGQRTEGRGQASLPITHDPSPITSRLQAINKFQSLFQRYLSLNPDRWQWAAEQAAAYHSDVRVLIGLAPPGDEETARRILEWTVRGRTEDEGQRADDR